MLYQKFSSLDIQDYQLLSQPDKTFYDAIASKIDLASLEFDEAGNYSFPF